MHYQRWARHFSGLSFDAQYPVHKFLFYLRSERKDRPDLVSIIQDFDQVVIDPAVLEFTRLVTETAHELMWDIGKPGNVTDITLRTRIEDITEMLGDVLSSLPEGEEEE